MVMGRNKKSRYDHLYKSADKYITINEDDSVLTPIQISLPKPPKLQSIPNYGKHPLEQKFQRLEISPKIREIESEALEILRKEKRKDQQSVSGYKIIEKFWELFDNRYEELEEEITFIKHFWWYCIYGYWVYIKGKPYWLPPWYFFYLHLCYMEEEKEHYPEFRMDNWKSWVFEWYCYTTHETFRDLDEAGKAIKKDGKYHMIEMANRTLFGTQEAKRRRCGATMGMWLRLLYIAFFKKGAKCTLSSFTADAVEKKIYTPIGLPTWRKVPICFKPINDMSDRPASGLEFFPPRTTHYVKSLNSSILLPDSSKITEADGGKYHGMGRDEQGKIKKIVGERWVSDKLTLTQEDRIHGYANHPSTVEEMEEGGMEYFQMWKESDFYTRKPNGQTFSGLAKIFWKSWQARGGYIDYWGFSVVDTPTEEQLKYLPKNAEYAAKKIGAKEAVIKNLESLLKQDTAESKELYRLELRKEPYDSTHCFLGSSGSIGFPILILDNRLKELEQLPGDQKEVIGNLEWLHNDESTGIVEWIPNPTEGKFECSLVLEPQMANLKKPGVIFSVKHKREIPAFWPMYPTRFIAGADPHGFSNQSEAKRLQRKMRESDGGGAVIMNKLSTDTDPDMRNWEAPRFVMTYRNRGSLDDYCEDMLKMAVYYGCFIFVEGNKKDRLWEYFIDHRYGNYMGYMTTPDGKIKDTPGVYLRGEEKNDLFSLTKNHIEYRGHKEMHKKLLQEWREISGPEMLPKYDLTAAAGQCLFGIKSQYLYLHEQVNMESKITMNDIWSLPYL